MTPNKYKDVDDAFDKKDLSCCGGDWCTGNHHEKLQEFIHQALDAKERETAQDIINDLESNPNQDGSISPNIQHWIEQKQAQLKRKYFN
jgi:hypothetical protein